MELHLQLILLQFNPDTTNELAQMVPLIIENLDVCTLHQGINKMVWDVGAFHTLAAMINLLRIPQIK